MPCFPALPGVGTETSDGNRGGWYPRDTSQGGKPVQKTVGSLAPKWKGSVLQPVAKMPPAPGSSTPPGHWNIRGLSERWSQNV